MFFVLECWILLCVCYLAKCMIPALSRLAAYGKLHDQSFVAPFFSSLWQFGLGQRESWRFFYLFASVYNALLLLVLVFRARINHFPVATLMMQVHVMRRLFETIFVHQFSKRTIRLPLVIVGVGYYVLACASVAIWEYQCTGYSWLQIVVALALFLWGSYHQHVCHVILAKIRTSDKKQDKYYEVPHGDWFEFVSAPHYLAEIVLYASFMVLSSGGSMEILGMFLFVVLNLSTTAMDTHAWYKQLFGEKYPQNRKAIIPWLL